MYQALQHVYFLKSCIANKRLILAILYSLETPIYLLAADFSSGLKSRLNGREGGAKSARRFSDYIRWAVEDADLETRRPDLTNAARAAIIAKKYPKENGTSLSNSAILKGIKMGKCGIQG